jgi:hypothetical protein
MSKYHWGTLYFVEPGAGPEDVPVESHQAVVSYLTVARELWQLLGRDDQAGIIEGVLDRAYRRTTDWQEAVLDATDLTEIGPAVDGLEESLMSTVLDKRLYVPKERLPELRARCPSIDLREGDGSIPESAIGSAMLDVRHLAWLLGEARRRGLHVRLGLGR